MKFTGKISPEGATERLSPLSKRQGDPRRKNLWFKASITPPNNDKIKQSLKRRQNMTRDKKKVEGRSFKQESSILKIPAGSIFEKQPATPHNTTQFITNVAHFSTESCVFNVSNDRFSQQINCHSMLGSMRNLVLAEQTDPRSLGANHGASPKEIRSCFSENAYELTKIRSESDTHLLSNQKRAERYPGDPSFRITYQASQIDIKQLLEEIKNGRNKLENVIQILVKEIQEKEDIITNLRKH